VQLLRQLSAAGGGGEVEVRGLHSSTSSLDVSALCGIHTLGVLGGFSDKDGSSGSEKRTRGSPWCKVQPGRNYFTCMPKRLKLYILGPFALAQKLRRYGGVF